jgi:hypothetical protein
MPLKKLESLRNKLNIKNSREIKIKIKRCHLKNNINILINKKIIKLYVKPQKNLENNS